MVWEAAKQREGIFRIPADRFAKRTARTRPGATMANCCVPPLLPEPSVHNLLQHPDFFPIVISWVSNLSFGLKDSPSALPPFLECKQATLPPPHVLLITTPLVTISHTWEDDKVAGGRKWCRALGRPSYHPAGQAGRLAADPASVHLLLSPFCSTENVAYDPAFRHQAREPTE